MNKKVLVISNNCFSKLTNNGKTLESIFKGINKSNISQLFFSDLEAPDFEFCNNYYRITDSDIISKICYRRKISGGIVNSQSKLIVDDKKHKVKKNKFSMLPVSLCRLIRDLLWSTNVWKSDALINWCKDQKFDYIFFVGGPGKFSHRIAIFLSEKFKLPLVTFFTDDYLINPISKNCFDYLQKKRIKSFYKRTISKSNLCFTIGELMSKSYSNYFKSNFHHIMNSVTILPYVKFPDIHNITVISYVGSLHTNRWKMIVMLSKFINKTNIKNIKFNIYTTEKPRLDILEEFKINNISYKGAVYGSDLISIYQNSDILLHVESNDPYSKSLTQLSVSTKIPEYLIAGRAILGFGPKDVASMKLLSDNKIGEVISIDEHEDLIYQKLIKILSNYNYRMKLGKRGYDYAVRNFDNRRIVNKFNNLIESILNN